jgi:nondiscriminating glutamyl-tRNA synthetase
MIYEAFGWEPPVFGHMTLIVNEQRKKLSKRDESIIQFIEQYDHLGYLPEALFNFIALLGWSPEGEQEMFSREELTKIFTPARLSKSPAVFDTQKLAWMNNEYIKRADADRIAALCVPHLQAAGFLPAEPDAAQLAWTKRLVALVQEKLRCAADIVPLAEVFFREDTADEPEAAEVLREEHVPVVLRAFLDAVRSAEGEWTVDAVKALIKGVQQETGFKGKPLFMPIRAALTGQTHGSDLNETIALLGREKTEQRLMKRLG